MFAFVLLLIHILFPVSQEQDAYVKYITDVAILLGADPAVAVPEMLAVFDLEKQLAQVRMKVHMICW